MPKAGSEALKNRYDEVPAYELLPPNDSRLVRYEFELLRRMTAVSPEKQLVMAILDDAVNVIKQRGLIARANKKGTLLLRETVEWFLSDESVATFSFRHVCMLLDLSPNAVLAALSGYLPKRKEAA